MDYEKGKTIENVIYELRKIHDAYYNGDEPMIELTKIYDKVDDCVRNLKRVLGEDDY